MLLNSLHQLQGLLSHSRESRPSRVRTTRRHHGSSISFEQLEQRQLLTVVVEYTYFNPQPVDLTQGPATSQPAAVSLTNGGLAVAGTGGGNTDVDIFNSDLSDGGGANNLNGVNSAIAQLSNSNLVVVSQDADSIRYAIRTPSGASVLTTTDIGNLNCSEPDVAKANGAFWIVSQDKISATNWDINVSRYDNNGLLLGGTAVGTSTGKDLKPSVAVLDNGNVVVAWHRQNFLGSEIWATVFSPTGGTVVAPKVVQENAFDVRNVDVTSTSTGFAMVYGDASWGNTTTDITMKRFSSSAVQVGAATNISNPLLLANDSSNDANPVITRLKNNMLVVGYEDNRAGQANTDTFVYLVDPATGNRLGNGINIGDGSGEGADDVGQITIAGSANGRISVFHRNVTDNDVDGEWFVGRRTSTSNNASDTVTGDFFIDTMIGGGGNDTLLGGGNDDVLNGGSGLDTLNGQAGSDTLTGGIQADKFVFTRVLDSPPGLGLDTVTDFSKSENDKIDVSAIDGKAGTPGINGFQFIGTVAFSAEGQISVVDQGINTLVQFNTTGTSGAEMEILLQNINFSTLTLSDFTMAIGSAASVAALTGTGVTQSSASPLSTLTTNTTGALNTPVAMGQRTTEQGTRPSVGDNQRTSATGAKGAGSQKRSSPTGQAASAKAAGSTQASTGGNLQLNTLDAAFADLSRVLLSVL